MFLLIGPLVLVAAVVAIVLWVRRSQVGGATAPTRGEGRAGTRVSLLVEAISYIGATLVVAGGAVAIGQRWSDISDPARIAVLGAAALVFLGIGAFPRSSTESAFRRLTGITWAMSVAAFAGTLAVVNDFYDSGSSTAFLTIATISTAYAVVLWWLNPRAIQHAVMFAGVLVSAASTLTQVIHDPEPWIVATAVWALALVWAWLGWTRRIEPWWMAVPLGLLVALIAPTNMQGDAATYALGIGTAGAVMALSVARRFSPGLALGAAAMLGYVVGAVTNYLGDEIGVSASLAITGLLILALGAIAARLFRVTTKGPRQGEPGEGVPRGADSAGRRRAA